MPANLFNFSKYFKKKDDKDSKDMGQQLPSEEEVSSTTVTTKTITSAPTSYSGIGKPKGGVAYSGIGHPPQQLQQAQATYQTTVSSPSSSLPSHSSTSGYAGQTSIDMKKRVGMDILSRLTQRSSTALMHAVAKAKELKLRYIDTEHVLWGLLQDSSVYQLISECKVAPSELQKELENRFKKGDYPDQPQFSPRVKRVLELALSAARSLGYEFISPEHILLALSHEGEGVAAQVLTKFGLKTEVLNKKITGKKKLDEEKKEAEERGGSTLEKYTEDLTAKAAKGELDPVVRRSWEIERVIHILSRRTKNNPVLIGDAGVGKTAIVEGLAIRIAQNDVPETLLHKKILSLDLMSLIAGARHRGEFEERLKNLIKEAKSASGAVILFIDEIHNMVGAGAGSEGTMDASNILKPSLARGELQTIGTTTITEYRKYIEKDPALERRFQPILVSEPSTEDAIEMLQALRDKYEAFHRVKISDQAIEAAVRLSHRYIGDRFLPDKAVDLIDEAAAAVRLPAISLPEEIKRAQDKLKRLEIEKQEAEKIGDKQHLELAVKEIQDLENKLKELTQAYNQRKSTTTNCVDPEIIADIVSRWTNIPVSRLTESESTKLLDLEDIIHKRLIGQDAAVTAVSEAVRRGRAGLKSAKRPIGSFIFLGPTGVGKTELAKTLAETLFGAEEMMVRLDMTEYMEKHEVAKLIGAPPGYVGYEEGGQLTEAVRRRPYSVVLFDEIEKAHPDVFNILIQLLDDGRLTDNKGHTVSFKNTIVICTSNIGTGLIQRWMVEETDNKEQRTKNEKQRGDVFKTYTISPMGREIVSLKDRLWEKETGGINWKTKTLTDYFAGCRIVEEKKGEAEKTKPVDKEFPKEEIDTHTIAPDGSETITYGDKVWFRTATTSKEWLLHLLLDQIKGHMVINALPDKPEEQLPTVKIDTHAVSPNNCQIITSKNRFWKRKNLQTKDWLTGSLSDYFKGNTIVKSQQFPKQSSEGKQVPYEAGKLPTGQAPVESQKLGDREKEEKDAQTAAYKQEKTVQEEAQKAQAKSTEDQGITQEKEEQERQELKFPTDCWGVHLFRPTEEEVIISGTNYWQRKNITDTKWKQGSIEELFPIQEVAGEDIVPLPLGREKEEEKAQKDEKFAELSDRLMEELKKFFRPEVLNRFDEVVVFRPLTRKHMLLIVNLQIEVLSKLLSEQHLAIEITDSAKTFLSEAGYDPIYGARPLRRTIQRLVGNPISSMIIRRELEEGDIIVIDFEQDELVFSVKKPAVRQKKADELKAEEEVKTIEEIAGKGVKAEAVLLTTFRCQDCGRTWQSELKETEKPICPKCASRNAQEVAKIPSGQQEEAEKQPTNLFTIQCGNCGNLWQMTLEQGDKPICPKCESDNINKLEQVGQVERTEQAGETEEAEAKRVPEAPQVAEAAPEVQQPQPEQQISSAQEVGPTSSPPSTPSLGQYFGKDEETQAPSQPQVPPTPPSFKGGAFPRQETTG